MGVTREEKLLHLRELCAAVSLPVSQQAGADVLFAPGLRTLDEMREVVRSVDRPVNVLLLEQGTFGFAAEAPSTGHFNELFSK
jgi:2-methylisocitrate lyase-like PEP mutase family enzyme